MELLVDQSQRIFLKKRPLELLQQLEQNLEMQSSSLPAIDHHLSRFSEQFV